MLEENTHSIWGASGASRWGTCHGSPRVIAEAKEKELIPEDNSTTFSKEGDEGHGYGEKTLKRQMTVEEIPEDFRVHIEGYVNHCRDIKKKAEHMTAKTGGEYKVFIEGQVPLFYRPQDRGTIDFAVVCPSFIDVTDLKYGAGIKVDAEENDQGLIYTISLLQELEIMEGYDFDDDTPVFISIYQPRHYSFTGDADTWEVTVGYLREAAERITAEYKRSKEATSEDCTPSEKACRFCPAKGVCRARAKTSFGGLPAELDIEVDFDIEDGKPDLPKPKEFDHDTLTHGQITWICTNGGTIKKIIEDVIKTETQRIKDGGELRGVKLIEGKLGNRTWVDEKEAEKFVRSILGAGEAYKPKQLLTAPQVLSKAKGKTDDLSTIAKIRLGMADETEKTKCMIHRPEGKPKLVPIDDEAEAIEYRAVEDEFDEELI